MTCTMLAEAPAFRVGMIQHTVVRKAIGQTPLGLTDSVQHTRSETEPHSLQTRMVKAVIPNSQGC